LQQLYPPPAKIQENTVALVRRPAYGQRQRRSRRPTLPEVWKGSVSLNFIPSPV
jgi:hypothetical protein